jgi:hypothetical protein
MSWVCHGCSLLLSFGMWVCVHRSDMHMDGVLGSRHRAEGLLHRRLGRLGT